MTSISSYSEKIDEVKYGLNKDGTDLEQINLALVIGETSLLPVYYRIMPGNISDVKTVKNY
jgi:transposase